LILSNDPNLFFSPIIGREPLIAAMNEIYGGRLPFLDALYTDTATQDALASSAYADLRTAIVTFVTGLASETLDASRIVQIVDKWQLLVLFDPVNPRLIRPYNLCSGPWGCHGPPLYLRSWRLFRSLCRPAAILRSPGDMVSYYNFDNFDSHPFHATSTPCGPTPSHFLGTSMTTGALSNYKALPSDVQHRYLAFSAGASYIRKQNLGPYKHLGTVNSTPTVTSLKFFTDGHDMHSFILRDGRRFVALPQIDTKQLSLNPPKLFVLQPRDKRTASTASNMGSTSIHGSCLNRITVASPVSNAWTHLVVTCPNVSRPTSKRALLNCLGF
jgi:hypothetical protein